MHENNRNRNTQQNHNTKYNVVHPQCRGYVHKLRFIPLSSKPQFICALSCRFLQLLTAAHIAAGFCAHSCRPFLLSYKKPSAHTAAEVVHAHSWDLSFPCQKLTLLHLIFLTSKSLTYPFSISAYLYCAALQKPWS